MTGRILGFRQAKSEDKLRRATRVRTIKFFGYDVNGTSERGMAAAALGLGTFWGLRPTAVPLTDLWASGLISLGFPPGSGVMAGKRSTPQTDKAGTIVR